MRAYLHKDIAISKKEKFTLSKKLEKMENQLTDLVIKKKEIETQFNNTLATFEEYKKELTLVTNAITESEKKIEKFQI